MDDGGSPVVTRPMVEIGRTESKLADNAANVRAGLDEALEPGRQRVPAEEAVLKHGSDRLGRRFRRALVTGSEGEGGHSR